MHCSQLNSHHSESHEVFHWLVEHRHGCIAKLSLASTQNSEWKDEVKEVLICYYRLPLSYSLRQSAKVSKNLFHKRLALQHPTPEFSVQWRMPPEGDRERAAAVWSLHHASLHSRQLYTQASKRSHTTVNNTTYYCAWLKAMQQQPLS